MADYELIHKPQPSPKDEVKRLRKLIEVMASQTARTVILLDMTIGEKTCEMIVTATEEANEKLIAEAVAGGWSKFFLACVELNSKTDAEPTA